MQVHLWLFQIHFTYYLSGDMDFSLCKRLSVRGYNKARQYSTVSADIKDCKSYNPALIQPNIVIDVVGEQDFLGKITLKLLCYICFDRIFTEVNLFC